MRSYAHEHLERRLMPTKLASDATVTAPDEIARSVILSPSYGDIERVVYPACAWLREHMPLATAQVDGYDPVWLVSRHADIQAVLRDADTFHSADINPMLHPIAGDEF